MKNKYKWIDPRFERWIPVAFVLLVLACWEGLVRTGGLSALFFPAPSKIFTTLVQLFGSGELTANLNATLFRVFAGFVLGGVPALILGLIMGWSRRMRALLDPFVAAAHPVPKIAILPLIMIIFGIGELSKVIAVAVAAFFPMLINTMAGVHQISPIYFDVAKNYGASIKKIFTRVVLPGSLPMILAGARLSLNISLLLAIAVELVVAKKGLGAMIWFSWETLRTEVLYASLFVTALLGIAFNFILQRLAVYLVPWHEEHEAE